MVTTEAVPELVKADAVEFRKTNDDDDSGPDALMIEALNTADVLRSVHQMLETLTPVEVPDDTSTIDARPAVVVTVMFDPKQLMFAPAMPADAVKNLMLSGPCSSTAEFTTETVIDAVDTVAMKPDTR